MKLNKYSAFLCGYFVLMFIYWVGIQTSDITDKPINLLFSFATAVQAFIGGIFGILISKHWGGLKSAVGKAVFFMSAGITSWSIGNFVWSFYNFILHTEMPYPSLADVGYVLAIPLWVIGIFYLSHATGANVSLRKLGGRIFLVVLPIIATVLSYELLFVIARQSSFEWSGGPLKFFLDLAYPVGDWVIITLALLIWGLSLKYLGGRYRTPVFITLLGFVTMFFADFSFSYVTTVGSYFNGSYPDLLFSVAIFLLGFGITSFDVKET